MNKYIYYALILVSVIVVAYMLKKMYKSNPILGTHYMPLNKLSTHKLDVAAPSVRFSEDNPYYYPVLGIHT